MIKRKPPIFAQPKARSGRYYIRDNRLIAQDVIPQDLHDLTAGL